MIGRIHSIESFSVIDGPGIRYVVFMQGCKLRCRFCHNPDTWNVDSGKEIDSEELVKNIVSVKPYFINSNGGVTFSGGEPLLQSEFLLEVCKKIKKEGIHITIDTSGNFNKDDWIINEIFKYVDLVLFDIKHIDSKVHQNLIGESNQKILDMAKYISNELKILMWIRIVYLPTITDLYDSLKRLKKFIKTLESVTKVDILPYHEMGKYKWKELGLKYTLEDIKIPSKEECKKVEEYLSGLID